MKIALDAMGGDFGPAVVVEGAVAAASGVRAASVLVGDKAAIEREIPRLNAQDLPLTIRHASQVVGMAEAPSQALRRKRDSSLRVAADLVKEGECQALVSAGNTGAAMAIGMVVHGRPARRGPARHRRGAAEPERLHRPARRGRQRRPQAAPPLPVRRHGPRLLPRHHRQVQPARRASCPWARRRARATTSSREAFEELRGSSLNFIGNVEGRDIYNGRCDVVVTDGFTGNVCLKISESLAEMLTVDDPRGARRATCVSTAPAPRCPGAAFARMKKRVDYTEMGGAPLLGINGASIICHGASPVKAIKNALRVAAEWVKQRRERAHQDRARGRGRAGRGTRGRARMKRAKIVGIGAYAPQRVLTNAELEKMVATSDEWIVQRTGIRERRIVDARRGHVRPRPARGAQQALERAGVGPGGDRPHRRGHDRPATCAFPTTANLLQHRLGCRNAGSIDVYAACSGSVYSLSRRRAVHPDRQVPDGALRGRRVSCRASPTTPTAARASCSPTRRARRCCGPSDDDSGIIDTDLYSDGKYWRAALPARGRRRAIPPPTRRSTSGCTTRR